MECLKSVWIIFFFFVISSNFGSAYKVLIVTPIGSKSLYHLSKAIGCALGDAGHDVTLINSFSNSSGHPKVKDVTTGAQLQMIEEVNVFNLQGIAVMMNWLNDVIDETGPAMWTNPEIISIWENRNSFDAIIMTGYVNEIGTPFLIDYKGVHISISTPGVEYMQIANYGHWLPLSVVPNMVLPFDEYMTFVERAINPLFQYVAYSLYYFTVFPRCQKLLENFFPDMGLYDILYSNSSLLLINGHFALDSPVPLLPNQIEIGTIIAKDPQILPKDILDFVEGSGSNGLIYFNLGTIVKSTDIPTKCKQILLNVFAKLPQRILWKYEGTDLKLPLNVMTKAWMPQQDILGHPKTRVFMSHCGNLGTQEAKYHGVPVLAMPVSFDQFRNAARITRQGFGLQVNWEDLTEDSLMKALSTLLNDAKYETKLKTVSRILHDQKESSKERAVWWIEYTIRHKGAFHMTYAGKRLHFLQYIMLDVIAAWLLVLIVIIYIWVKIILFICRKCISNKLKRKKD